LHLRSILSQLGKDPDRVLPLADSQAVRSALEAETEHARQLGIFGSPTFACGTEIFWGDDRFEDAIEWSKVHPT
jgi:2-hydroxychromene-2-carboxylate isomerase